MANTTADKLAKLAETKSNIKQAIIDKGVSVSDTDTFASYAGKIGQISGGGGIPNYIAPKNNVNGVYKQDNTATSFNLNGATDIYQYTLARAFSNCTNLTSVDLLSLTTISGSYGMCYCFNGCKGLTSVDLSSLTTISGSNAMEECFSYCTNLTSVDLSSLTTISGGSAMSYCLSYCTGLTSVDLPSLTTISGSYGMNFCFAGCANLTTVGLSSLTTISGSGAMANCFWSCKKLTELRFPALQSFGTSTSTVNQFSGMLTGVTGCTLHFPSNMQSEVERRTGYPNFGGTNTVVLFKLPPTA